LCRRFDSGSCHHFHLVRVASKVFAVSSGHSENTNRLAEFHGTGGQTSVGIFEIFRQLDPRFAAIVKHLDFQRQGVCPPGDRGLAYEFVQDASGIGVGQRILENRPVRGDLEIQIGKHNFPAGFHHSLCFG
jgi:hypothetical protein